MSILDAMLHPIRSFATRFAYKGNGATGDTWNRVIRVQADPVANIWPDLSKYKHQAKMYNQSSWVYIAVDRKASAGALVNLNVMRYENEKKVGLVNHPLEQLMRRPNDWQSQYEFMYQTLAFQELTGNAYWFCDNGAGQPSQLMLLRPDRVRIVPGRDSQERIRGYVYTVDGIEVPLAAEEVFHLPLFNPTDDYYGLSRLEAAMLAVSSDVNMQQWNANYFGRDKAVPAGLVNIKGMVGEADYERIKAEWQESYGGVNRRTAVIRGADLEWMDIGTTHKDMDFGAGRQFNKEEILQIFGIPPGLLDKNATEANANAALELFTGNTIWPMMVSLAQKVGVSLAPRYGDDLIVEPDDIRRRDAASERADIQAASMYLTINEVRERFYNLPPRPDGDIYASGAGAAAITGQPIRFDSIPKDTRQIPGDAATEQEEKKAEAKSLLSGVDVADVPRVRISAATRAELKKFVTKASKATKSIDDFEFRTKPGLGLEIAVKAWADIARHDHDMLALLISSTKAITPVSARVDMDGNADPHAKQKTKYAKLIQSTVQDYLDGLQQRVIAAIKHVNKASKSVELSIRVDNSVKTGLIDDLHRFTAYLNGQWWSDDLERLAQELRPIIQDAYERAASDTYDILNLSSGISLDPSAFNADAAKYAKEWTDSVLKGFGSTNQNGVGAILSRWIGTPGATLEDLTSAIQESKLFSEVRSTMVAETEATRAFADGTYLAAEAMADAAGVDIVEITDENGKPPLHVKCRCWIVPQYVYGENYKIIRMDFVHHTNNDDHVCELCAPLNGKLYSDIIADGDLEAAA